MTGGTPSVICDVPDPEPRGGTWSIDNVIVFSGSRVGALSRVSASGGTPQPLTSLDKAGFTTHRWPTFLPDGRHFLYFASSNNGSGAPEARDAILFASVDGKETRTLLAVTSNAAFAGGRLLFAKAGRLVAQPFDPVSGALSGDAVPVLDGVAARSGVTRAMFSATDSVLVAQPDESVRAGVDLRWIARDGSRRPVVNETLFSDPTWLSSDESRLLAGIVDPRTRQPDIWILDLKSNSRARITFGGPRWSPIWSKDGSTAYFIAEESAGALSLRSKAISGGEERRIAALPPSANVKDCSDAYCVISVWRPEKGTNYDLMAVRLADGVILPVAETTDDENEARLSPDGRFIAYMLTTSGDDNVVVKPFPSGSGFWQISTSGGSSPAWARDGRALYFVKGNDVMAVPVNTAGAFTFGAVRTLMTVTSEIGEAQRLVGAQVASDGRVLAAFRRGSGAPLPYRLVLNWNR